MDRLERRSEPCWDGEVSRVHSRPPAARTQPPTPAATGAAPNPSAIPRLPVPREFAPEALAESDRITAVAESDRITAVGDAGPRDTLVDPPAHLPEGPGPGGDRITAEQPECIADALRIAAETHHSRG